MFSSISYVEFPMFSLIPYAQLSGLYGQTSILKKFGTEAQLISAGEFIAQCRCIRHFHSQGKESP